MLDITIAKLLCKHYFLEENMANTFEEIKTIIIDLLGADEEKITLDARFREDLEADSLDLVELIMAFEDKFEAEISDEDAQTITTVGEAVRYIEKNM
jgi:acyl carrier protein